MSKLDDRLNAHRPDLADLRLEGVVEAVRFVAGEIREVAVPIANLHRAPRPDAMLLTQALLGEKLEVFEERQGWAWVRLIADGYVGYIASTAIAAGLSAPTHRVAVPGTFLYPAASLKSQPAEFLGLAALVEVVASEGNYARLASGKFVFARHLRPLDVAAEDYVSVAEQFLHTPYFWGGKSVLGLDCSGLVQLALLAAGIAAPRDSDMQQEALGQPVALPEARRGDLVFWDGHVAIVTAPGRVIHANGNDMQVAYEPLDQAIARIAQSYGKVTSCKRLVI